MHLNLLTDVGGVRVGNAHDRRARTGVTVVLAPGCVAAGVDARGGAPGTRETEALKPENLVGRCDAVVLAGGSVFGLAAADAVAVALSARGVGLRLAGDGPAIPIVPAAVLHDLGNGGDKGWGEAPPYAVLGRAALDAAGAGAFALGPAGAGAGARAGLEAGGLGSASEVLADGLVVGAVVAVNPVGTVRLSDGTPLAWAHAVGDEIGGARPGVDAGAPDPVAATRLGGLGAGGHATVIAVVAVGAELSCAECRRVAIMAHDGIARAVYPAHTPFDGDVVFALSMPGVALAGGRSRAWHVARIGTAAADCLARAIMRGVAAADG